MQKGRELIAVVKVDAVVLGVAEVASAAKITMFVSIATV